jgi:hypothetical protein
MRKLFLIPILLIATQSIACRYTIREIGFSTLSQTIYQLYWIEEDLSSNKIETLKTLKSRLEDNSNLKFEILVPATDQNHGAVKHINDKGITPPALILKSPDGRYLSIKTDSQLSEIFETITNSIVQNRLFNSLPESYAVVLLIEGKDKNKNSIAEKTAIESCTAIKNVMPNMPKVVEGEPVVVKIGKGDFEREKILLWCLGIDRVTDSPSAFVIYGRGRVMSEKISFEMIKNGDIYKFMSIVGADCECGLDRKWMLGEQVILRWTDQTAEFLYSLLGFDVENPMTLAEMSRIIATEKKTETTSDISFEPQTIDIDKELGNIQKERIENQDSNFPSGKIILIALILLFSIIIAGIYIFIKKRQ